MALSDYQFSYTVKYSDSSTVTLTFGEGTDIDVIRVAGLQGIDVRVGDRSFTRQHGDVPGEHWLHPREVAIEMALRGDPSLQAYWDLVDQAVHQIFQIRPFHNEVEQLNWKFPGEEERFIRARVIHRNFDRRANTEWGYAPLTAVFRATDPRIYGTTLYNSGASSGTFNVTNNGIANVYPKLTFNQSGTATLTNNTFPNTISITGQPGGTLVADMDVMVRGINGLVVYIGSTNYYGNWAQPRSPFYLGPGTNSLTLTAGTSVTVEHRDTWV